MPNIVSYGILQQVPENLAPILEEEKKLGQDKYQIIRFLGYRGRGRLYEALELPERQPCVIKEYILPKKYFDDQEAQKCLDVSFWKRAKVELAEQKKMDFRLILPIDVISNHTEKEEFHQESCYLVTPGNLDACDTLSKYLRERGAMTDKQVGHLLNQVLQTLNFLHTQKFRLPYGKELDGLAHGNLSLDSLLIAPQEQGFLIYLCDLELWEGLFVKTCETEASETELSEIKTDLYSVPSLAENLIKEDLKQLGLVAFYLLSGGTYDCAIDQPLDPKVPEQSPTVKSGQLKDFISQLINGHFTSADNALQKLIEIPGDAEYDKQNYQSPLQIKEEERKNTKLFHFLLVGSVFGLLLALVSGFGITQSRQQQPIASQFLPCCIKQVPDIPSGNFTYTAAWNSTWNYILRQKNLIAYNESFKKELDNRKQPKLRNITYLPELSATTAIAKVSLAEADFAIASFFSLKNFQQRFSDTEVGEQDVIPDPLVVFVSNCGASRKWINCDSTILEALKSEISLGTLGRIYQGEITNWSQIGGPNLPVKLYIPTDNQVVKIFEQKVFKNDFQEIEKFRKFRQREASKEKTSRIIHPFNTFKEVSPDFKNLKDGGIGFAPWGQVLAECSVYPLGIDSIFPLIQDNGGDGNRIKPVELCQGSYLANVESFITKTYPLAYDLKNLLNTNLGNELRSEKFAYDGLVVFVPFTYAQTKNSLTKALKGKISLENLRKLYTDVDNKYKKWKDLDENLPDIPIQLYIPSSEEAVHIFEQQVLKDEHSISAFKKLIQKPGNEQSFIDSCSNTDTSSKTITRLRTLPMLTKMLEKFYDYDCNIGSIGFDTLSKVFGQCSVYPLALSENNSELVSPLIQDNKPITPETDLCNDKGNYQPNIEAFINQSYPLAYPMVVIYPKDNRRQDPGKNFANLLRTIEAQRLLKEVGLIPLKAKSVNFD